MIKSIRYSSVILAIALLLASCSSEHRALQAVSSPETTAELDGLSVTLKFRDDASLIRQFGTEANPFITEYYRLFFRRFITFEMTLTNQTQAAYPFKLSNCRLEYGGKEIRPINKVSLLNYWQSSDAMFKTTREREPIINKYVLPDGKEVPVGGMLRGYLVFQGDLPLHGEAKVSIPAAGGKNQEPLWLSYTF
jgi:hypothetical protein